jgi:hypothetical protein
MTTSSLQIISHQEQVKVAPAANEKQTLHERMCFMADDTVRHNLSDVAVHDARILKKMCCGEVRLWIVTEFGTHFLPMSCKVGEWKKQESKDYVFSSAEVMIARLLRIDLDGAILNKSLFASAKFYMVAKGYDSFSGSITPISFADLTSLIFPSWNNAEIPEHLHEFT